MPQIRPPARSQSSRHLPSPSARCLLRLRLRQEMLLFLQCICLTLLFMPDRVYSLEMTSSSWRCVDRIKAVNVSSVACSCSHNAVEGFPWTNVDCSRRNFTEFATNTTLPLFIQRLDLSRNRITVLRESPFQHWNPLKELILTHNGMVSIVDNPFSGLVMLTSLDLSHNSLSVLPSNFLSKNKRLTSINLNFNNLANLPADMFSATENITSIHLSHNIGIGKYFNESPKALLKAFKSGLRHLEMNNNDLLGFPANFFSEASNLNELSLSDNPFKMVPGLFTGALETLNLSGCSIEKLDTGDFINFPLLKYLYLDRLIHLSEVAEGAFDGLNALRVLSMENCVQLRSFHGLAFGRSASSVQHLQQFSLIQGGLQVLSSELKPVLMELESLQLHGNPWHCDCDLAWMLDLNMTAFERKKLRCFSPPHLREERLFSLRADQMSCLRPAPARVRSGIVVGMAVLLGLVCLLILVAVLDFYRRNRPRYARRVGRYRPIEVQLEANRAECDYDWEDKEQTNLSVTQNSGSP